MKRNYMGKTLAPYQITYGLNMRKQELLTHLKDISAINGSGYEVLFDDRLDAQAGFKFNMRIFLVCRSVIVGDKNLKL